MTLETALKIISGATWLLGMPLLAMPIWRVLRGRPRSLDPLWTVVAIGVFNRLVFVGGADRTFAYAMAILVASIFYPTVWMYQRGDK